MTDANLMDADCIHGKVWWECEVCVQYETNEKETDMKVPTDGELLARAYEQNRALLAEQDRINEMLSRRDSDLAGLQMENARLKRALVWWNFTYGDPEAEREWLAGYLADHYDDDRNYHHADAIRTQFGEYDDKISEAILYVIPLDNWGIEFPDDRPITMAEFIDGPMLTDGPTVV